MLAARGSLAHAEGRHSCCGRCERILERMAHIAGLRTSGSARLIRIGGVAGLAGGLAWVIKGVAILAADDQPPLAFGVALPLFGLSLVGVAHLALRQARRTVVVALPWLAVAAGLVALMRELLDIGLDTSIAASSMALLIGQLRSPGAAQHPPADALDGVGRRGLATPGRYRGLLHEQSRLAHVRSAVEAHLSTRARADRCRAPHRQTRLAWHPLPPVAAERLV